MTTPDDILDDAERRWQQLADAQPDLAAAVDLQRVLVTRSAELLADADRITRGASAAPDDLDARLARREGPLLDLAVDLDTDRLAPFLLGFCDDFIAGGAGDPARRVRTVLAQGGIEPGSLFRASLARRQTAIRERSRHLGVAPDLVWLVAELSVGPIAHRLQDAALAAPASAAQAVRTAVRTWPGGACPACGSWPALAECRDGARHLRCSFCGADWQPPAAACVHCAESGAAFLLAAAAGGTTADDGEPGGATAAADESEPASGTAPARIEFCRACGAYLKQIDVPAATPFLLLPVLDLETSGLDRLAAERGYARPAMRSPPPDDAPCPPPP